MVIQGKTRKKVAKTEPPRPSPVSRIEKIASLKRYPDKDYALDLLHQMARAVAPLIHEYKFKVGTLCEMFPKSPNLLGLNVNRGQKILIRLRPPHNDRTFFPMGDLIGTFLHELTHNVHGPHDAKFYAFLDELRRKYETGAFLTKDYVCEESKLGGGFQAPWASPQSMRQKRLEALSKGMYKAESRRVGGKAPVGDLKKAMLEAAERRLRDSKWCSQNQHVESLNEDDDLEVQVLPPMKRGSPTPASDQTYKDVIDLTKEEVGDDDDIEIIAVDACEHDSAQRSGLASLRPSILEESSFTVGNFEMRSTVRYYVSSSPGRTFIGDEMRSRRKVVADLDFEHIIESSSFVEVSSSGSEVGNLIKYHSSESSISSIETPCDVSGAIPGNTTDMEGNPQTDEAQPVETNVLRVNSKSKKAKSVELKPLQENTSGKAKNQNGRKRRNGASVGAATASGENAKCNKQQGKVLSKDQKKELKSKSIRKKKTRKEPSAAEKKKRARKEVRCVSFSELF
ncbi:hypothetical protein OXX80_000987 [Metschnikowia pulcherrima]